VCPANLMRQATVMTASSGITRKLTNQATHLDCYPDFCDRAAGQGVELWEQIWEQNSAKRLGGCDHAQRLSSLLFKPPFA
jgi:hypothetical protein